MTELTEGQVSLEEIAKTQGTRLQELPPWMSYAASFDEKLDPELEEQIKQYSEVRHEKSSSQNEDEYYRQKELSDETAKQYQFIDPEDYKDRKARVGKILPTAEFISILRNKCHLNCWYADHVHADKLKLMVQPDLNSDPTYVCWVQNHQMQEFSQIEFDEHDVPLYESRRGWRTVLLQLVLKSAIKEVVVNKVFGRPEGKHAYRYNLIMYGIRNADKEE